MSRPSVEYSTRPEDSDQAQARKPLDFGRESLAFQAALVFAGVVTVVIWSPFFSAEPFAQPYAAILTCRLQGARGIPKIFFWLENKPKRTIRESWTPTLTPPPLPGESPPPDRPLEIWISCHSCGRAVDTQGAFALVYQWGSQTWRISQALCAPCRYALGQTHACEVPSAGSWVVTDR